MKVLISALIGVGLSTVAVVGGVTTYSASNNTQPNSQSPTVEAPGYADQ